VKGNQTFSTSSLNYHEFKSNHHKQALSSQVDSLDLEKLEIKLSGEVDA
jgi:hypothetical protein